MRLLIGLVVFVAVAWGAITGINSLLSVDDLKDCPAPKITTPKCAPADAIVAISGGDTSARVTESIRLYNAGWAPKLIFSGAALDKSGPSNAEAMRLQALAAGVPDRAITLEHEALDTTENAFRTSALLTSDINRLILVTSPYHQRRAGLEFKHFLGSRVEVINHPTPYDRFWSDYWWTLPHSWWLALSESVKTLIVMAQK